MRITSLQVYSYSLPLTTPIIVKKISLNKRQGLVLQFTDEKNQVGFGEVAPLPGLSRETLEETIAELKRIGSSLLTCEFGEARVDLSPEFQRWLNGAKISPSTRFGVEMGVLDMQAASRRLKLYELFSSHAPSAVEVNALLSEGTIDVGSAVEKLMAQGYQTIKLKVGRDNLEQEIRRVWQLREAGGKKVKIRLDANRAWSLPEAIRFAHSVRDLTIEYIEEPLRDSSRLSSFYEQGGLPVALDESLITIDPQRYRWETGIKAIVLKPTVVGGFAKTIQIIRSAQSAGVYPVFSSVFESGLTLSILSQLAAVFSPGGCAAGLDTCKWLKEDILHAAFCVRQGRVEVEKIAANSRRIDFEKLKLIFAI